MRISLVKSFIACMMLLQGNGIEEWLIPQGFIGFSLLSYARGLQTVYEPNLWH